ncbi:type II toxin-antitoxin system VapC family toxin [Phytohabitans aurantiacus]|uniref:Twitching motility protein PilT n=1 Tax=Phytohabitans aurantiacus TaxID=3016789 RepID=A0ABQ5QMI0_9ACTN|nr:type II toxin-antitoxin system VapC family toxin [Phytohabitans aurantiacus]GLH95758.1 twitching motility protein PilT [Phytohabitans aurantiacus]
MRLLLDTHVVLWWLADDPTLSDTLKSVLDGEPDVYLSPVSVWEIAIKQAAGKIKEPADLAERLRNSGFKELGVTAEHAVAAGRLPMLHRDPFDRMLVAQARCADLMLVTRDADIRRYEVPVIVA